MKNKIIFPNESILIPSQKTELERRLKESSLDIIIESKYGKVYPNLLIENTRGVKKGKIIPLIKSDSYTFLFGKDKLVESVDGLYDDTTKGYIHYLSDNGVNRIAIHSFLHEQNRRNKNNKSLVSQDEVKIILYPNNGSKSSSWYRLFFDEYLDKIHIAQSSE